MNIVYIDLDDIRNPLLGAGQAHATYAVGKELVKLGHSVTVYCSSYPGCQDRTEEGIVYKHIGISTNNIKLNNFLFFVAAPLAVRHLDPKKVDIIIESYAAPLSTLLSPLFTKIPVVALPSMFNAKEFAKKYHLPFEAYERWGVKFYKYAMPYSDVDTAKFHALNSHIETRIIPQGVGTEFFEIEQKKPEYILFLSRLDIMQKGIDLLLESYAKVKDSIGYPLVIAGHGPDEAKVKALIQKYQLESSVTLAGSAYGEKKKELIEKALYTVFPSRHDEMCLWSLEALASGLPLIGFDIPESAWGSQTVFAKSAPFDTDKYAQLLVKSAQPEVAKKMRKAAREFAKRYSWTDVARQFGSFFEEILEKEKTA